MSALIREYGFDGIDIDLEHGLNVANIASASRQLRNTFGANFSYAMAPQTIDVQPGGRYVELIDLAKDFLTVVNTQYYNSGSMTGCNGAVVSQGTVDFITAQACYLLQKLRADQVGARHRPPARLRRAPPGRARRRPGAAPPSTPTVARFRTEVALGWRSGGRRARSRAPRGRTASGPTRAPASHAGGRAAGLLWPRKAAAWDHGPPVSPHRSPSPEGHTLVDMLPATKESLTQATVGLGIGAGELATADMVLNIGPQHPSTHGVLRLALTIDGEKIIRADPIIGYMHRGADKLFEARDYRQIIVLANRHDWLSAFSNELGVVIGVERMMGLETPERALWIRTLMAELNRVLSHLMFLGSYPIELGAITPMFYAFREREEIQAVMEELSGGRMHFMFNRVGGLKEDLPAGWKDRCRTAVRNVRKRMSDIDNLLHDNEIFHKRTKGIGVLSPNAVLEYGVSGPIARASGVDFDLRRDEPYLKYSEVDFKVVTRTNGDCFDRFEVLLDQVYESLNIAEQCLDKIPGGPVNVKLPKVVKAPEGHTYAWTENPLGINGYYLVSRGEKTPWRMHLRSASFNNVHALAHLLPGTLLPDLVAIMGSMFFVVGDVDK